MENNTNKCRISVTLSIHKYNAKKAKKIYMLSFLLKSEEEAYALAEKIKTIIEK